MKQLKAFRSSCISVILLSWFVRPTLFSVRSCQKVQYTNICFFIEIFSAILEVHKKVVDQRDQYAHDCEQMRRSATPR